MRINRHPEHAILDQLSPWELQLEPQALQDHKRIASTLHTLSASFSWQFAESSFMSGSWCGGRRLCELLEQQQEPFLVLNHGAKEAGPPRCSVYSSSKKDSAARMRSAFGRGIIRRAVRLVGCFSCGAHGSFFQQLPRPGDTGGGRCDDDAVAEFDDGGRRLSPMSVLDVLRHYADEESSSPTHSSWEEEEDDDNPRSTPGSSPSPDLLTGAATSRSFTSHTDDDRTCAHAPEEATTTRSEEVRRIISSWERIARVPMLAELDLSSTGSAPEWRRFVLGEAAPVGASIEAMIFMEVRAEAVRDMLSLSD